MRTNIPEKLLKIAAEIDQHGNASLTKLTVLKKWFERPQRLAAFALWTANRAVARKGETTGATTQFFQQARILLQGMDPMPPQLNRDAVTAFHDELRDFQSEYQRQQWGTVRIIQNWNLMLVEHGLAIYLWHQDSPTHGYKLAADFCQHYDPRYGNGLNGPSRTKIAEIVRFMFDFEALEGEAE